MTPKEHTLAPGWERINNIRRELYSIPIVQLPETPRLHIAAMLNDLALYTSYLEAELRNRSHEPPRNPATDLPQDELQADGPSSTPR